MSDNKNMMKSLRDRAKEFDVRLPFMEGRDKGETRDLLGSVNTITDYGFLPNEHGEPYAVFVVDGVPKKFYFGGTVITDRLFTLDAEGYGEVIRAEGLPVRMTEKRSKNNRTFTNVEFFPED